MQGEEIMVSAKEVVAVDEGIRCDMRGGWWLFEE